MEENKMSIFQIIAEETAKRFGQDEKGYEMYKAGVKHYKDVAKEGYRVLCEYFNGAADRTGISVVPEERCISVMGYDITEGSMVLAMMYELNITEKQGGLVVL